MSQQLIHVYLMPGMAASSLIFEHIRFPEQTFKVHKLEWIMPTTKETIGQYAQRMVKKIEHDNIVLLGVSFGGVLVQEMSKYIKVRKLIIVSSVKNRQELPRRMKLARLTKTYRFLPTRLAGNLDVLAKYAFGKAIAKRLELYKKYLSVSDSGYLDWAIREMVCWNQTENIENIVHIHGDKDMVFPIRYINNCIVIPNGTHIMIINKYRWFNKNLPKLIMQDSTVELK